MAERWLLCVRDEMAYSAIRAHMNPDGFGLFPALLQRAPPLARPNNTGPHNNRAVLARGPDPSSHIPDLAKMLAHHVAMTFSSRRIRRLHGGIALQVPPGKLLRTKWKALRSPPVE